MSALAEARGLAWKVVLTAERRDWGVGGFHKNTITRNLGLELIETNLDASDEVEGLPLPMTSRREGSSRSQ